MERQDIDGNIFSYVKKMAKETGYLPKDLAIQ